MIKLRSFSLVFGLWTLVTCDARAASKREQEALRVARDWVNAMAAHDAEGLRKLAAFPFYWRQLRLYLPGEDDPAVRKACPPMGDPEITDERYGEIAQCLSAAPPRPAGAPRVINAPRRQLAFDEVASAALKRRRSNHVFIAWPPSKGDCSREQLIVAVDTRPGVMRVDMALEHGWVVCE